jgi:hypothetical protein
MKKPQKTPSIQLCILGFSLLENWDVGVRIFPHAEEVLKGRFCLRLVIRQCVGPGHLHVCQSANRIAENDASVVENFLEFHGGLGAVM